MDTATQSAPASSAPSTAPAVIVGGISAVLAVGCALLALGHAGVGVPLLSRLGPGGSRVIAPAAAAFAVAAVLAGLVAVGAFRRRPWAWALGLVVHALALLSAVTPYRGGGSLVGVVLTVAALAVLLSPAGRQALVPREVSPASAGPPRSAR